MRILFLAHCLPYPPNKGEKIRAFHEIEFLSARHTIDLFCFAHTPAEAKEQQALRGLCRRVYVETLSRGSAMLRAGLRVWGRRPFSLAYFFSPKFQAAVRRTLAEEKYDLIFVYCSSMAQYVPQPAPAPVVVDFVDMDSGKWAQYARVSPFPLSWLYTREARCLAKYERELAGTSSAVVVATAREAAELDAQGPYAVEVIGNGVRPRPASCVSALPEQIRRMQPYVLFVGTMDYLPNVDAVEYFADEILPQVRSRHPELRFVIAGRNPSRRARRLARRPGVVVTGTVPEVDPYLLGAAAVVAPFRLSQGVQNKILEALAAGKPVVSTSRPAHAIGARHGETLLVADTPAEFAGAVVSLLEDPHLRKQLQGTEEFIRRHFDWPTNLRRLEDLLERLAYPPQEIQVGVAERAPVS